MNEFSLIYDFKDLLKGIKGMKPASVSGKIRGRSIEEVIELIDYDLVA